MIATKDRVRIVETRVLSDDWYLLKKTTFDFLRRDGVWQRQSRETYDRGDGAVILLFNRQAQTVVLTRQFRFPVFVNGHVSAPKRKRKPAISCRTWRRCSKPT